MTRLNSATLIRRATLLAWMAIAISLTACASLRDELPVTGTAVPAFQPLDSAMREGMRKLDIPGASITVSIDGSIIYQRGFGYADRATGQVVSPDTLFRIASVSKPMTAVAVLRAFETELPAALDRPVFGPGGLLTSPRYTQFKDPAALRVTLRDLLQHTSGWDSSVYEPQYDLITIARAMNVPAPASPQDIIEYMLKFQELQVAPGTRFIYSNFGYNLLGRVLEEKTGQTYEQAMHQYVFVPAGALTPVIGNDKLAQRLPSETVYYDDPRWPNVPSQDGTGSGPSSYNAFHLKSMDAHGGWVMTSADMVRFADAVDGRSRVKALLAPITVKRMTTQDRNVAGISFGLGWEMSSEGWSHTGLLTTGTHAKLERLDSGVTWAVVYNSFPGDPERDIAGLLETTAITLDKVRAAVISSVSRYR